jgi:hypothetical protein
MSDLAGDGPGRTGSAAFSLVRFEREIFPFLQCTQWIPSEGAGERDRLAGAYDVVFPRGMLEGIRREAKKHPEGDCVGVFYGVGCECPWTRRLWVRVDSTAIENPPARKGLLRRRPTTVDGRPIGERLAALLDRPRDEPGTLLGWFRTRRTDALVMFASESESFTNRFREPWQFSVLLPAPGTEGAYGVFGRDEDGRIRDGLARPFYEHEETRNGRDRRPVAPTNYHLVERATELPGSTGAWREVQRQRAPALVTAACMVFGVAGGLALSYELSRASQPGGFLGESPTVFASPGGDLAPADAGGSLQGLVAVFEGQVAVFNELIDRPADASTYCDDLQAARDAVHGAFLTLIRRRDELSADTASEEIERAIQEKGRVDSRFERADCVVD